MVVITHAGDPERALRQQREFYELLGRAISQWAHLEDNIYHTFRVIVNPGDWVALAAAYHSTINSNARLDMISAGLAVSRKYKSHLPKWEKLRKDIRKHSARRAKLAHWTVVQDSTRPNEAGVAMYLHAPTYAFGGYGKDGRREEIEAKRIAEWANGFARLGSEIEAFWRQLA
jgi:hypothetical protein